jgi:hypothetical protein
MFWSLVHLMLSLSISCPYLIQFHDFADNIQERMKHQMGLQLRTNRAWLSELLKYLFFIFHHENRSLLKMWKPIRFSDWMPSENLSGSHLQWEPSIQFSWQFSSPVRIGLKTNVSFQSAGENRPTLIMTIMYLGNLLNSFTTKCKYLLYLKEGFQLCRKFSWR